MVAQKSEDHHHLPVMAGEVVEFLLTDTRGAYLDLTAGGGGHMKALAARLDSKARIYGVDCDAAAIERTTKALESVEQFKGLVRSPFGSIATAVDQLKERAFDGILLDLGISSDQLDDPERGISFRFEGPLDMRLDPGGRVTAKDLVNTLGERELKGIIKHLGEERQAARIARAIVMERQKGMILTTGQLKEIVLSVVRPPHQNKSLARVFQALRIAVNRELEQLENVLPAALSLLNPGGRLVVIAYHSLEDRIVKRFFQAEAKGRCTCPADLPACVCGATPMLKILTRKPVLPTEIEVDDNPRARSARLRVAERLV